MSGYRITAHTNDGRKYRFRRGNKNRAANLADRIAAHGFRVQRSGVRSYYPPTSVRVVRVEAAG